MIERERSNISLTEEFTERAWTNYDSFENETKEYLATQNHVDLRTFLSTSGEAWTTGTYGYTSGLANFPAMSLPVSTTTETQSSTPKRPIDLLTGFSGTDILTFALPSFPLSVVNTVQSTIEITSDPLGHCSNTKLTATVNLQQSLHALVEGNSQFSIERSALQQNEINLEAITGVRFKIVCNTGKTGTVEIMGLKLILGPGEGRKGWVIPSVDYDNWNGMLRKPSPLNGNTTNGAVLEQGTLWHSAPLPGYNDPIPVDTEFGITFNPGSQEKENEVTLYARQESEVFQTQLDLIGVTQSQLDGHPQPDLGTDEYLPRTVGELDKQEMMRLDHLETMEDLERIPVENPVEQSWVYFNLKWGEGQTKLIMSNSTSVGYVFPKVPALKNHTEYLAICSLEDSSAQVQIFELNADKSVNQEPVFDSTLIEDDSVFRRRKGRVGWQARLGDADAYINSIRPRSVVYAEYRSAPLTSFTPVDGAQLFASFSGNEELWNKGFEASPEGTAAVSLSRDAVRTLSGESFRVDTNGTEANVGISTDLIEFIDFTQAEIRFSIWFEGEPRNVGTEVIKRPRTYKELEESIGGGSPYQEVAEPFGGAITDTFNRTENPLSNGGKWSTPSFLGAERGQTGEPSEGEGKKGYFSIAGGAFWNAAEYTNPAVAVTIVKGPVGTIIGRYIGLWSCMPSSGTKYGYFIRWASTNEAGTIFTVTIEKWNGGVKTVLLTLTGQSLEVGDSIGSSVSLGKVIVWHKRGGVWSKLGAAADTSYTKGCSGIQTVTDYVALLTNFQTEESPAPITVYPSSYERLESLYDYYGEIETQIETTEEVLESNIIAQLVSSEGTVIPLPMPQLETNQWQEVILPLPTEEVVQTGKYYVQILQPTLINYSWWIDDVSIFERAVQWSARSTVSDPWNSNYAPWTDFREIVNVNRKGILLAPRGKELQLRGRALRQNAQIKAPKIVPRYASLGRLVFPDEELVNHIAPTALFKRESLVPGGKSWIFTDESTPGTGAIAQRVWSFGDGSFTSGNNVVVEHSYAIPGEYYVTLVVIDRNGVRSQFTEKTTYY